MALNTSRFASGEPECLELCPGPPEGSRGPGKHTWNADGHQGALTPSLSERVCVLGLLAGGLSPGGSLGRQGFYRAVQLTHCLPRLLLFVLVLCCF